MTLALKHVFMVCAVLLPLHLFAEPTAEQKKQLHDITQQAELGSASAMVALGYAYEKGELVEADAKQAGLWFQRASEKGSPTGMVNLGLLYNNGEGVPKDEKKAFTLFGQAADLNDITGFYYLARCYTEGIVVEENFLVTYSLLTLILQEGKGTYDKEHFIASETETEDESEYIKANVYAAAEEILSLMEPDLEPGELDVVELLTQAMRKKGNVTTAIQAFLKKQ